MVLKPEPLFLAVESIWAQRTAAQKVLLLSAQGRLFDQAMANRLSREAELLLICGRYEGVDERVAAHLADDEISIGNYVLSGGELAAAVVIDTVARLLPGVLGQAAGEKTARLRPDLLPGAGIRQEIERLLRRQNRDRLSRADYIAGFVYCHGPLAHGGESAAYHRGQGGYRPPEQGSGGPTDLPGKHLHIF